MIGEPPDGTEAIRLLCSHKKYLFNNKKQIEEQHRHEMRIYVNVPYAERNNAKKLGGGQFDSICKK